MAKVSVGERVGERVNSAAESLGDYLKEQRNNARLSLRQLAEQAGVSNPYLSQIERGLRKPSAEVLAQIAKALRISAESLYVRAGIISPEDGVGGSVELAVLSDTGLTERQKQSLLDVYSSFLALNETTARPTEDNQQGVNMAKAKFEIKFDLKSEATRTLHAGVGVVDLAVETVKELATDAQKKAQKRFEGVQKDAQKRFTEVQKSVTSIELEPKALREQAAKEAAARRDLIEKRVAALQADAQKFVTANVETATETYEDLAKRGETVVRKFRNKPATKATVSNAKTTKAKAKTTATQAKKSPAKKSAKATGTAAKKTVKSAPRRVS